MLATNAHVKIGSLEYLLAEELDNHYVHRFETQLVPRLEIIGQPGKAQVKGEKLLWAMDDWSGGEGSNIFYPDDPYVYSYSLPANPRIRGQLTGRPARAVATVSTNEVSDRGVFAIGEGVLWMAQSRDNIAYTTDGTTWNAKTTGQINLNTAEGYNDNFRITSAAGDHDYLYYAAYHSAASGTRVLKRIQQAGDGVDVVSTSTGVAPFAGLTMMGGRLYAWTGAKLQELDIFESVPLTNAKVRRVSPALADPPNANVFSSVWWANCISTENSVLCFYSTAARSVVYEFHPERGFYQLWQAPYGLTIKSMMYQNGIVYFAGHWGGDSNMTGRGVLYAMSLDMRRPLFINWFRKNQDMNLQMQEMANSYGSQVMVAAARSGKVFIYDTDMDGISLLDDLEDDTPTNLTDALDFDPTGGAADSERISDMATYGTKRFIQVYRPGGTGAGNIQVVTYTDDEPINRQYGNATNALSTTLYSSSWDFDFPHETKVIHGFHVGWTVEDTGTTSGLLAGQTILVEYKRDGEAWETADTVTSATSISGGVKGRHYIVIPTGSVTKKFYELQVRVTLKGTRTTNVDYQPPILKACTAEAQIASYYETWELLLRVKDEQALTRPSDRSWPGTTIRDYLEDLAQNKNAVTFLDGYRYRDPGAFTTHTVTIDEPVDVISRNAEGVMRIKLKAVSV